MWQSANSTYSSASADQVMGPTAAFSANGEIVDRRVGIHSNGLYADKLIGFCLEGIDLELEHSRSRGSEAISFLLG